MAIGKLIYDSAMNRVPAKYSDITKEERENRIRKEIFEAIGLEMTDKFDKKAYRRAMRDNKTKVYSIIEEVVDQVMLNGDYKKDVFFEQFVEVKNLALGDENKFYVEGVNELEIVEFSGSHFNIKRRRYQSGSSFMLEMKDFGVRIFQYFELVMAGREDFSKWISRIADAVNKKLSSIAQGTLTTAVTNLPTEFKVTGSYNEPKILEVLQHVEASNGVKPTIVGTSTALSKLQGAVITAGSSDMKNEKNQQGYLRIWNGYSCMEIEQGHKQGTFTFTMPNDKLYFLCGDDKLVKMVLEGESQVREINEGITNADGTLDYTLTFKANAAVAYSRMIGYAEFQ